MASEKEVYKGQNWKSFNLWYTFFYNLQFLLHLICSVELCTILLKLHFWADIMNHPTHSLKENGPDYRFGANGDRLGRDQFLFGHAMLIHGSVPNMRQFYFITSPLIVKWPTLVKNVFSINHSSDCFVELLAFVGYIALYTKKILSSQQHVVNISARCFSVKRYMVQNWNDLTFQQNVFLYQSAGKCQTIDLTLKH